MAINVIGLNTVFQSPFEVEVNSDDLYKRAGVLVLLYLSTAYLLFVELLAISVLEFVQDNLGVTSRQSIKFGEVLD